MKISHFEKLSIIIVCLFVLATVNISCEVTGEDIETWKGTIKGPKKLAGAMIDPKVKIALRSKAAYALIEIEELKLFRDAILKMEKDDAGKVLGETVSMLAPNIPGEDAGQELTKLILNSKDALYLCPDYLPDDKKTLVESTLIGWCTGNYNKRAMAGEYNIKVIVKKIGSVAADALIPLLQVKSLVLSHVADLIKKAGDEKTLKKASAHYAKVLKENNKTITVEHLEIAAVIGGSPVGSYLLESATNKDLSDELQRFSLRAFSLGMEKKTILFDDTQIEALTKMAENIEFDQFQREEAYYVLAQSERKEIIPKFEKLLVGTDSFWRAVGLRCILRMDGENKIENSLKLMEESKLYTTKEDVDEIITRIAAFPTLMNKIINLTQNPSAFIKGISICVLSKSQNPGSIASLEKLLGDNTKLPAGFAHGTVSKAAMSAISEIKKKGN